MRGGGGNLVRFVTCSTYSERASFTRALAGAEILRSDGSDGEEEARFNFENSGKVGNSSHFGQQRISG